MENLIIKTKEINTNLIDNLLNENILTSTFIRSFNISEINSTAYSTNNFTFNIMSGICINNVLKNTLRKLNKNQILDCFQFSNNIPNEKIIDITNYIFNNDQIILSSLQQIELSTYISTQINNKIYNITSGIIKVQPYILSAKYNLNSDNKLHFTIPIDKDFNYNLQEAYISDIYSEYPDNYITLHTKILPKPSHSINLVNLIDNLSGKISKNNFNKFNGRIKYTQNVNSIFYISLNNKFNDNDNTEINEYDINIVDCQLHYVYANLNKNYCWINSNNFINDVFIHALKDESLDIISSQMLELSGFTDDFYESYKFTGIINNMYKYENNEYIITLFPDECCKFNLNAIFKTNSIQILNNNITGYIYNLPIYKQTYYYIKNTKSTLSAIQLIQQINEYPGTTNICVFNDIQNNIQSNTISLTDQIMNININFITSSIIDNISNIVSSTTINIQPITILNNNSINREEQNINIYDINLFETSNNNVLCNTLINNISYNMFTKNNIKYIKYELSNNYLDNYILNADLNILYNNYILSSYTQEYIIPGSTFITAQSNYTILTKSNQINASSLINLYKNNNVLDANKLISTVIEDSYILYNIINKDILSSDFIINNNIILGQIKTIQEMNKLLYNPINISYINTETYDIKTYTIYPRELIRFANNNYQNIIFDNHVFNYNEFIQSQLILNENTTHIFEYNDNKINFNVYNLSFINEFNNYDIHIYITDNLHENIQNSILSYINDNNLNNYIISSNYFIYKNSVLNNLNIQQYGKYITNINIYPNEINYNELNIIDLLELDTLNLQIIPTKFEYQNESISGIYYNISNKYDGYTKLKLDALYSNNYAINIDKIFNLNNYTNILYNYYNIYNTQQFIGNQNTYIIDNNYLILNNDIKLQENYPLKIYFKTKDNNYEYIVELFKTYINYIQEFKINNINNINTLLLTNIIDNNNLNNYNINSQIFQYNNNTMQNNINAYGLYDLNINIQPNNVEFEKLKLIIIPETYILNTIEQQGIYYNNSILNGYSKIKLNINYNNNYIIDISRLYNDDQINNKINYQQYQIYDNNNNLVSNEQIMPIKNIQQVIINNSNFIDEKYFSSDYNIIINQQTSAYYIYENFTSNLVLSGIMKNENENNNTNIQQQNENTTNNIILLNSLKYKLPLRIYFNTKTSYIKYILDIVEE